MFEIIAINDKLHRLIDECIFFIDILWFYLYQHWLPFLCRNAQSLFYGRLNIQIWTVILFVTSSKHFTFDCLFIDIHCSLLVNNVHNFLTYTAWTKKMKLSNLLDILDCCHLRMCYSLMRWIDVICLISLWEILSLSDYSLKCSKNMTAIHVCFIHVIGI